MLLQLLSSRLPPPPLHLFFHSKTIAATRSTGRWWVATRAAEEPQQFEVDQERAREALRELDEELRRSLSAQDSAVPKHPPSLTEPMDRDSITGMRTAGAPDMPESFFAYTAVALLFLTIFNNLVFNEFIKPAVDGKERATIIERVPMRDPSEPQSPQLVGPR